MNTTQLQRMSLNYKGDKMSKLKELLKNVELTAAEAATIEWLEEDPKRAKHIAAIISKVNNRSAGRKRRVDSAMIRVFKKEGKTQEWIAKQMGISVSTVKRNWND